MSESILIELLAGAIYAGIHDKDMLAIGRFFEHLLGEDGHIEVISGSGNIEALALTFVVNEGLANGPDNENLQSLIAFLQQLDGSLGLKAEHIGVAINRTVHP